jgi:hypothetical protein
MQPSASPHFTPIDLAAAFNTRRADLPETLAPPDWLADRGAESVFRGISFRLGTGQGDDAILLERDPVTLDLGGRLATYVVFLHQAEVLATEVGGPFGAVPDGNRLGDHVSDYRLEYDDGPGHDHAIVRRFAIQAGRIGWGASPFAATPAWDDAVFPISGESWQLGQKLQRNAGNAEQRQAAARDAGCKLWLYALPNPQPHRPIRRLVLSPRDNRSVVFGVATTELAEHPLRREPRRKLLLTLPAGATLNAIGELDDVGIDLGQVISARQQMVYDPDRWRVEEPDAQPTASATKVVVEYTAHPKARLHVGRGGGEPIVHELDELPALADEGPCVEVKPACRRVRLRIVDKATGTPVGVRLHLHGEAGEYLPPRGYHRKVNGFWFEDRYGEFVNRMNQYAYVDGACEADLPLGRVYVEITRGYEVAPIRTAVEIDAETDELTFELERVLDWRSAGWVTADTHVHFLSPATARLEGSAEDVSVVNLLASQWGEMFSNVTDFDGRTTHGTVESGGDGQFLVRVGSENRMQVLGHISLLGYTGQLIHPLCTGGPSESALGDPQEVTMAEWAERCRAQQGMVVMPHAPNPQCERVADVVLELIDAIEMMTFNPYDAQISPYGLADWYRFLNAGYHLPLVGGSDKMSAASLLGGVRTYTHLGDRPFTYENWMAATRAGNTFVTVGPLVDLKVEGRPPGQTIELESGGTLAVEWRVESVRVPIEKIELVVGGRIAHDQNVGGELAATGSAEVKVDESTWIALMVRGSYCGRENDIAAHSSAVVARVAGHAPWTPRAGHEMLQQIEGALAYLDTIATRPDAERYRRMRLTLETAWNRLHQRMHQRGVYHQHTPLHDHAAHHEH